MRRRLRMKESAWSVDGMIAIGANRRMLRKTCLSNRRTHFVGKNRKFRNVTAADTYYSWTLNVWGIQKYKLELHINEVLY